MKYDPFSTPVTNGGYLEASPYTDRTCYYISMEVISTQPRSLPSAIPLNYLTALLCYY